MGGWLVAGFVAVQQWRELPFERAVMSSKAENV
jgi:hypothetical protein